jgi:PAS domain S-box-containing protein
MMSFYLQRRRARAALVLSFLVWPARASAQVPFDHLGHDGTFAYHRSFAHLGSEDGLGDDTVYAILQDRTGFVWIGTESGLVRYDGHRLIPFLQDPENPEEPTSGVSDLLESEDGTLWIATWGDGIIRRDPTNGSLTHFPPTPDLPNHQVDGLPQNSHPQSTQPQSTQPQSAHLKDGRIQTLLEDRQGTLWIGTFSEGLASLDPGATTFKIYRHDPQNPQSLPDDHIWALAEHPDGTLWVGTHNGLARLDPERRQLTRWQHDPQDPTSLTNNNVRSLLIDRDGILWVGTRQGLGRFEQGKFQHYRASSPNELSYEVVNVLLEDHLGGLWIGSQGGGLNYFDPDRKHFDHFANDPANPTSLRHNDVRALMEDRHHNLWVATRGGGVDRLDLKQGEVLHIGYQLENPGGLSDPKIRDLARDRRGRLWVATPRGLDRYQPESGTFRHFRHDPKDPRSLRYTDTNKILVSAAGDVWVASFDSLSRFLGDERGFEHFMIQAEPEDSQLWVLGLAATTDALWLGTTRGLQRFGLTDHQFSEIPLTNLGQTPWLAALASSLDGRLWIATQRGAILLLDPRTNHTELFREPTEEPIYALRVASDGKLWVALRGSLEELDLMGGIHRHTSPELADTEIVAVLEEEVNRLWLSTGKGLWQFDRPTSTFHRVFGGPPVNRFSRASLSDEQTFTLGSNNGFYVFDPARFTTITEAPTVVLTDFRSSDLQAKLNYPLEYLREIGLQADDENITLEFTALEFTQGVTNRYRYRFQGVDGGSNWVELGEERTATLTNLKAGGYLFEVQAMGSNSHWSEAGLRIQIRKPPPWWRTLWFRMLAASLTLTVLFAVGRWRRLRLQAHERHLNERIAEAIADLEQSEARYRALFERNLAGVVRAHLDGRILECNHSFAQIFGYRDATTCQQQLRLDFDHGAAELRRQLEVYGQVAGYEWTMATPEDNRLTLLWNAILTHRQDGEPLLEGTVIDLSVRRRAEERLERARKLESLGILAGGIAHDFNNLLTGVLGQTELARRDVASGSRLSRRLDRIEAAAEKAANLSRQMLAYAGRSEAALVPVDLTRMIQRNRQLLQEISGPRVEMRLRLTMEPPTVEADEAQLTQVLLNLVRNAAEAISGTAAGTIIISTGIAKLAANELSRLVLGENLAAGRHVYLQVSDTGHGMEESTRAKIFDPFFTTRFIGRGLGLATVFGIVKGHQGAIEVESKRGRGTRVRILLPAVGAVPSGTEELEPWTDEVILQAAGHKTATL